MSTPIVSDILYGPGVLWSAAVGTPIISDAIAANGDPGAAWNRFGFTEGPTSFAYERDERDVMANEYLTAVKRFTIAERGVFGLKLSEMTPGNAYAAAGTGNITVLAPGSGSPGYEYLGVGGNPTLTERMYCLTSTFRNAAGYEYPVRLYVWRATARIVDKFSWEREATPGISMEIHALADTSKAKNYQLFALRKVTSAS